MNLTEKFINFKMKLLFIIFLVKNVLKPLNTERNVNSENITTPKIFDSEDTSHNTNTIIFRPPFAIRKN